MITDNSTSQSLVDVAKFDNYSSSQRTESDEKHDKQKQMSKMLSLNIDQLFKQAVSKK